jgi:AraC family transcriptional regulator
MEIAMQVDLIERKPAIFVGLARPFIHGLSKETNAPQVIGKLWHETFDMHGMIKHRVGKEMFGVIWCENNPTRKDELMYLAGVEVSAATDLPLGAVSREVPGGLYARILHRGVIGEIANTVSYIYREWLPKSGYEHSEVADIEIYGAKFNGDSENSEMDYLISVRPRSSS